MVSGPAAAASRGNMLEVPIIQPHPRTTDSETRGGGRSCPAVCIVTVFQVILPMLKLENNHYRKFTKFLQVLNWAGIISILWGDL